MESQSDKVSKPSVRRRVDLSLEGVKSSVPRQSNPQSREIVSPVFQRGHNDFLWPSVTEGYTVHPADIDQILPVC